MNDAKAKAYTWCAEVIHDEWADTKPDAGDGDAIDAEIVLIMDALFAAAENRANAPEVPPADLTMVAPGFDPTSALVAAAMERSKPLVADAMRLGRAATATPGLVGAPEYRGCSEQAPPVAWCERQGHAAATDKAPAPVVATPAPSPPAIEALPEVPAPPCPRCGEFVKEWSEHPCGLPL